MIRSSLFFLLGASALSPMTPAQNCGGTELLGTSPGFAGSGSNDISADGSTVVGTSIFGTPAFLGAFRWTRATGLISLGTLGGENAEAFACSADGSTVVGASNVSGIQKRPFRWTQALGMQDIFGIAQIPDFGSASDVSADGQIVVGNVYRGTTQRGFVWSTGGTYTEFDTLAGFTEVIATSADGQVVVGFSQLGQARRAFRWTQATGAQDLGDLGGTVSEAYGVSADGSTIVGMSETSTGIERAFRWTQGAGMQAIDPTIVGDTTALDVSADGNTIVGRILVGGVYSAYVWNEVTGTQALEPLGFGNRVAGAISDDGSVLAGGTLTVNGQLVANRLELSPLGSSYCLDAVPNSSGCPGRMSASGSLDITNQNLTLTAEYLPTQVVGFFLAARAPGLIPFPGASQGNLCLSGGIGRLNGSGQIQNSGGVGSISLALDLSALPTAQGPTTAIAGETWYFQAWHRDMNPATTSNFTDALAVTFQ